jgi:hypothetical protein
VSHVFAAFVALLRNFPFAFWCEHFLCLVAASARCLLLLRNLDVLILLSFTAR